MTTTISITTHDWPVEISILDDLGDEVKTSKQRVEAQSVQTIAIWGTRSLHFRELPRE